MKTLKLVGIFLISIALFFTACKKDSPLPTNSVTHDTVRIIIHDTLRIQDTVMNLLTRTQLLTQSTWKVDQLSHVIANKYSNYEDGGSNTTGIHYENLRFTFKSDGTGTNVDQFNATNQITWKFLSSEREIQITVLGSTSITYIWKMTELTTGYLHATVNLTINGSSDNLESFRLKLIK